jgi:hypothetical protein
VRAGGRTPISRSRAATLGAGRPRASLHPTRGVVTSRCDDAAGAAGVDSHLRRPPMTIEIEYCVV